MSKNIPFLKELLDYVQEYESLIETFDIKEFSFFLKDKIMGEDTFYSDNKFDKNNYLEYKKYAEVQFSTLLTNLYRFAKHYIKKVFEGKEIKTIDEFGFLSTLLLEKSLMKKELISRHLLEVSSGSEVLKRLIKKELIIEFPDENDKRAKRVAISEKGKIEIFNIFDDMHKVSEIIKGNANKIELKQALSVFNKLNFFHQHIHEVDKDSSIDEIYQKYVLKNIVE